MLLGLEQYVNYLLDVAKCSRYYLGGFCRMDATVKHMIAMVSTCSCVSDQTTPLILLEDDRLALRLPEVDLSIAEDLEYVLSIS